MRPVDVSYRFIKPGSLQQNLIIFPMCHIIVTISEPPESVI